MSFFDDYKTVKGNSIRRVVSYSLVLLIALVLWYYFSIDNNILILSNTTIGASLCIGFLSTLNRAVKNKKIKDIDFDVFKNYYFAEYIITFLYFVLFSFGIVLVVLIKKITVDISALQIVFILEGDLLMFAIAPFIGILCGTKVLALADIAIYVIISVAMNLVRIPGILIVLVLAALIPVLFFSSNYIFLKEMKKLIDFNKTSNGTDTNNIHPLIRDYKIYTGSNYSKLLISYGIMIVLLFAVSIVFIQFDGFESINISIQSVVVVASISGFAAANCNPSELYKKRNCYFLSVKNIFKTYKNYYLLSYGTLVTSLILFVILSYVFAGVKHLVPESFFLKLVIDIEGLLVIFAVVPYLFTSRSSGVMVVKVLLLTVVSVPLKIFLNRSEAGIPAVIILAIGIPFVMYFSNKYWFKKAEKAYMEI
ncbi:MAG: hypothetical protein MJ185_06455 [Treponema sp.]|nr:hypothetical protein [Treponema sp.]